MRNVTAEDVMAIQAQTRISDRYVVGELLGQGLGSAVYRGEDETLKRPIVLKLVPHEHITAYRAALGATARIGHPAYVGIYDALEHEDQLAIIQEFVSGERFEELVRAQPSPLSVAKLGRQLALALAHAHRQGITHGDLTPAALFRDHWGALRINNILLPPDTDYFTSASRLLKPGDDAWNVVTPTPRDDLRAAGVVMWLMLAGRVIPPTEATGLQDDWQLVGRDVPSVLRDAIERLIDPDHPHTVETAEAAAEMLNGVIHGEEERQPRRSLPPWSAPLPPMRHDQAETNPAVTAPPMAAKPSTPAPPTIPATAVVARPLILGKSTPRNDDDQETWVGARQPPPPQAFGHAKPPFPVTPASGRFDYALWAALAVGLFIFWLIVGYLVPGLLGK
jgi:serine/threonine protein kinase